MARVPIEIDIPDGYELACSEMRRAKLGELFLNPTLLISDVVRWNCSDQSSNQYVIVRPAWQWPSWLKKFVAVAQEEDGRWFAWRNRIPLLCCTGWTGSGPVSMSDFDFTSPPCAGWRQSLRLNPNREAKS